MSLFDANRPTLFDIKKRLGNVDNPVVARPVDEGDSNQESWVELAPSRASLCSSIDAIVLVDSENGVNKDSSRLRQEMPTAMKLVNSFSPVSLQSPHVEFESNLEQVKYRLVKDMLPPGRNTDWIWDWSSRPEALPPKAVRYRSGANNGSTLTTPPNSPAPEPASAFNLRHSSIVRSAFFRVEVLVSLMVSNLVTFVLGAAIGFCICKKLTRSGGHDDF